jgi:hypothetical protein
MKIIDTFLILLGWLSIAHSQIIFSHYQSFDVNNISTFVRNNGILDRDPVTGNAGFEWPKGSGKYAIYESIPWLIAKVNGEIRLAGSENNSNYTPGPMDALTHKPANPSDSKYRVYKIVRGDTISWDYQHWPSSLGAPVQSDGKPLLLGDQTLWCVYNCADSTQYKPYGSKSLGLEVQQTVYGYNALDVLFKNLMIVRYLIINKSQNCLDSMYFGYWSDPDIGDAMNNRDGCDSAISLWYCYNSSDNDAIYGLHPPAVGYSILQGPHTESSGDTALFIGRKVPGNKNIPMTSFVVWNNDVMWNPRTLENVYSYFQAFWWSLGRHITYGDYGTDSLTLSTNFMYTGDPDAGTGWLSSFSRHEFCGSGVFSMAPGDTQEIVMGILVSQGSSNTKSVTILRNETRVLADIYRDSLYKLFAPTSADAPLKEIPELYHLAQNYPNPFNAGTEIQFSLPINSHVTLTIYNLLGRRIAVLASGYYQAGSYIVRWEPTAVASGIYVCQLNVGRYVKGRRMVLLK